MKKILFLALALTTLTACSSTPSKDVTPAKIGMANPASQYCVEQGGQQIKQKTKSEIVRSVGPNQPVTMDYRENRVTVMIDPQSKKILSANCG